MFKPVNTVLLNTLQMRVLDQLKSKQNKKGVIERDHVEAYNTNVIDALVRRGVLRNFYTNYTINSVRVILRAEPKKRPCKPVVEEVVTTTIAQAVPLESSL